MSDVRRRHLSFKPDEFTGICNYCSSKMKKVSRALGVNYGDIYECPNCKTRHHVLPQEKDD